MSIHEGHRKRLRYRVRQEGMQHFAEHEVLEFLLTYAIPRIDVNPLAHRLIQRFGSLAAVLEATVEELTAVEGVGESAATLLHSLLPVLQRYQLSAQRQMPCLDTPEKVMEVLRPRFWAERDEVVYLICLDASLRMKSCELLCRGGVRSVDVDLRKLAESALRVNAVNVILAHNHPGGMAVPSVEDCVVTEHIMEVLDPLNIRLCDHVIVAGEDCASMAQLGKIPTRFG